MNPYISENIKEAKDFLNRVEDMGLSALHIAERILDSNKLFIHDTPKAKIIKETLEKITKDFEDARSDAIKQNEAIPESYEKHINIANYLAALDYEKVQKLMSFWDKMNGTL
jgi:phosphomevalonate kinase